jgi:hypothetical protein
MIGVAASWKRYSHGLGWSANAAAVAARRVAEAPAPARIFRIALSTPKFMPSSVQ